jgi:hypothetical protein
MSVSPETAADLRLRIEREWRDRIAPFWIAHVPDEQYGGFHGRISNELRVDERADKGAVLNARILWTFSRAFGLYGDEAFRRMADRAYAYLADHFLDREHGGVFWSVDYLGRPADTRKTLRRSRSTDWPSTSPRPERRLRSTARSSSSVSSKRAAAIASMRATSRPSSATGRSRPTSA